MMLTAVPTVTVDIVRNLGGTDGTAAREHPNLRYGQHDPGLSSPPTIAYKTAARYFSSVAARRSPERTSMSRWMPRRSRGSSRIYASGYGSRICHAKACWKPRSE
jgi:hypothetical protein